VTLTRRHKIAALVAMVLLLGYAAFGFFGVPRVAERIVQQQVSALGHQVDIGDLRFNPFTFEAAIERLELREADGAPLLGFESLYVNLGLLASIRHRAAALQAVHWTAPDLAVIVEADGALNLSRLAPPAGDAAEANASSEPPRVRIDELRIERGRIGFEDRSRTQGFAFELSPISFGLADFSTQRDHLNAYAFHGEAKTGETLDWRGEFTVQPLGASGEFSLRRLQAQTIADYLREQAPVHLAGGSAELEGRYRMTLGDALDLNVDLSSIRVRDLALAMSADPGAPRPVEIGKIGLQDLRVSLAQQRVTLARAEIVGAKIAARRTVDGAIDLQQLYRAPGVSTVEQPVAVDEPTALQAAPWQVQVGHVALRDGAIQLTDDSVTPAAALTLAPVTVNLRTLSTLADTRSTLDADIGIDGSGRLQLDGDLSLTPLAAQLQIELQDLGLPLLQPYLATATGITLASGTVGTRGSLQFALDAQTGPVAQFNGDAGIADLDVRERNDNQSLFGWQALQVKGIDFDSAPQKINIAEIVMQAPQARVEISEDRQLNLLRAFAPTPTSDEALATSTDTGTQAPLPLRIGAIRIDQGQMRFTDRSIQPQFSAGIVELNGELRDLALDERSRASIRLDGKVDDYAPVKIEGELIPSAFGTLTDIAMSFRNIDLIRFNPYSGRFAGYNIERGKLTTELRYRIRERALEAEHHVVVDQLEFGEATGSEDAVPLPVKLAVALLKDRHGVIDLNLPVRGDLDDPSFNIGALVWKTLRNLLNKAVTAPFALLGSLAGGGAELAWVDFTPGSATLAADQVAKLRQLAAALVERPQLRLDIPLTQTAADREALARAALDARLPAADGDDAAEAFDARVDALEDLYDELLDDAPDYPDDIDALEREGRNAARVAWLEPRLLEALAPTPQALVQLAVQRARTVQAAVLDDTGVAPERTFLTRREAASLNEQGQVRMDLALQ
jgi:hypothetical protein